MIEIIKPDFINNSDRGILLQLVHDGWKQVNVVKYHEGVVSGGHYHKYNVECFFIASGRIHLTVWRDNEQEEYDFQTGDMFKIEPFVFHTLSYIEDSVIVALYDHGVELDENTKDIWSE